jgi:hypothetical protein
MNKSHFEQVQKILENHKLKQSMFRISDKDLQEDIQKSNSTSESQIAMLAQFSDMMRKIYIATSKITDIFRSVHKDRYDNLVKARLAQFVAKEKNKLMPGSELTLDVNAYSLATPDEIPHILIAEDVLLTSMLSYFNGQIYKIAENFGEHLYLTNLDVQAKFLPKKLICCIEFPDSIRFKIPDLEDTYVQCVYVFLDSFSVTHEAMPCMRIYLPHFDAKGKLTDYRIDHGVELGSIRWANENEKLSDVVKRYQQTSTVPTIEGLVEYIVKCVLYINSGDPDLREYKAPKPPSKIKKARKFYKDHENQSLVDMTLVGYNFKKEILYNTDETIVRGFFRWQHYGPQNSLLKYIWIDEHPRVYKNVKKQNKNDVLNAINLREETNGQL